MNTSNIGKYAELTEWMADKLLGGAFLIREILNLIRCVWWKTNSILQMFFKLHFQLFSLATTVF